MRSPVNCVDRVGVPRFVARVRTREMRQCPVEDHESATRGFEWHEAVGGIGRWVEDVSHGRSL